MKLDTVHAGFRVERVEAVQEINGTAYLMKHEQSGARLLYIDTEDTNKVFHIAFRTPPHDSTGVAHILEHSVLCGSRKFPLREPFVELVKGSLNTFLNAMTYSDKTVYPVASKNDADFHNLMDVYLDAVLYPRVANDPMIVMQEGWHYELDTPEDPLTYKGVVYNEMKGVYSSPDSQLDHHKMKVLYPDTTYGHDSGGYPENITDLTYENFKAFYESYYHPSNSYIYLYGDMNIEETLSFINDEYLSNFHAIDVDSTIAMQTPLAQGVVAAYPYGIGQEESESEKTIHSLTYVFPEMTFTQSLAFEVLTHALLTSGSAPLKEAIVKANIGSDVSGYYMDGIRQPLLEISVTGSELDKQGQLQEVVESTLRQLVDAGLDKELLEASLNRIEFTLREADFGGRPIGLAYGLRVMDNWLYDEDPIELLRYEPVLKEIREGLQTDFFENLLRTYILDNTHKALVSLYPQKGLQEEKETQEKEKLAAIKANMSAEEIQHIVDQTAKLKDMQMTPDTEEALATIPLLELSEISPTVAVTPRREMDHKGIRIHHIDVPARGINYVSLHFNMEALQEEEVFYAELLSDVLGRLDAERYTYTEVAKEINLHLGGYTMDILPVSIYNERDAFVPLAVVRSKALASNIGHLTSILGEIIGRTKFTAQDRLVELLKETKAIWDTEAFRRGNTIVTNLLLAQVSNIGKFRDQDTLGYFRQLVQVLNDETALSGVAEQLMKVQQRLFRKDNLEISFVGTDEELSAFLDHLDAITNVLSDDTWEAQLNMTASYVNEGLATSGKVQYVAKGGNFRDHGGTHTGTMSVLETMLRYDYLWNLIRVQGGAYGAFANFHNNGNMVFCSYRDPNLENTLNVYDGLPTYLRELELSPREMRKYIIGTMSSLDLSNTPFLQAARAMSLYYSKTDEAQMTAFRQQVLDTTVEDLQGLADVIEAVLQDNHIVVMGNEQRIKEAGQLFDQVSNLPQ
ncbi:insulinase family protein [Veillonella sp. CHU110]|uniref:insulinase family protein n=1 Tax=Veillonella sp. CHU110 TaxID=2490947 RepID=UPI000F8D7297|nr:insulinase family protein [Veillonella sp. CHU110]